MKLTLNYFFSGFFLLVSMSAFTQQAFDDSDVVQFSGVIVQADDLSPVPYTTIKIKNTRRGTISDFHGYFSIVVTKLDTLTFSAIGFKENDFIVPDTITQKRYSLIHVLDADTIMLTPTVIYPWPTVEEFQRAFVELDIPDDDLEIARKNLQFAEMRERGEHFKMDGSMNYRNYIDQQISRNYYYGQTQPLTIFNPFAWAQFIQAWKEGKFKRNKED
jgi:hypothetical protein